MKSSAWDNKLWQNKMQEIPLDGDADLAWSDMQGLLDEVMPVTPATPVVKTPWSLPKSRLLTIAYTAAAAAIILFAAYFLLKKQHQKAIKHHKENVKPVHSHADSLKQIENRTDPAINTTPGQGRVTADSLNTDASSAKNNINAATVSGNKAIPVNSNNKKGAIDDTPNSQSRHQGTSVRPRSTTNKLLSKYANNTSVVKGRHGIANSTVQTQNLAASSTSSAGLKNKGNHRFGGRRGVGANNPNQHSPTTTSRTNNADQNGNKNMLADNNASKTNGLIKPSSSSTKKGNKPASGAPVVQLPIADSSKATANKVSSAPKPTTANNAASVKNKPSSQTSTKSVRQPAYSKFEVAIEAGINSGRGSTTPFAGLYGIYAVDPKFSISIGGNIFSSRTITGKYSISKYQYTTQDDSTGQITSHTAKNLVVSTSQKLHTLEIPLMASYKLTKWLSIKGGPVISIPIKTGTINNTLAPVGSPLDTARAFKTLSTTVNSTAILNKVTFNFSGGVLINVKRLYLDASYVQGTGPYTIYSSLGSNEVYYHYLQIGIGYKLFQSKPKPQHN